MHSYLHNIITKTREEFNHSFVGERLLKIIHNSALGKRSHEEFIKLITSKYPYLGLGLFLMVSISSILCCFWCCKNRIQDDEIHQEREKSTGTSVTAIEGSMKTPVIDPEVFLSCKTGDNIVSSEDATVDGAAVEEDESKSANPNPNPSHNPSEIAIAAAVATTASVAALTSEALISPSSPHAPSEERSSDMSDASTQRQSQRRFQRRVVPGHTSSSSIHSNNSNPAAPHVAPQLDIDHMLERCVSRLIHEDGIPDPKAGYLRKLGHSGWSFNDRYFTLVKGVLTNFIDESQSRETDAPVNREDKHIKLTGFQLHVQAEQFQFVLEGPASKRLVIEVRKDGRKKIEFALWKKALTEHVAYANGYFHLVSENESSGAGGHEGSAQRRKSGSSTMSF